MTTHENDTVQPTWVPRDCDRSDLGAVLDWLARAADGAIDDAAGNWDADDSGDDTSFDAFVLPLLVAWLGILGKEPRPFASETEIWPWLEHLATIASARTGLGQLLGRWPHWQAQGVREALDDFLAAMESAIAARPDLWLLSKQASELEQAQRTSWPWSTIAADAPADLDAAGMQPEGLGSVLTAWLGGTLTPAQDEAVRAAVLSADSRWHQTYKSLAMPDSQEVWLPQWPLDTLAGKRGPNRMLAGRTQGVTPLATWPMPHLGSGARLELYATADEAGLLLVPGQPALTFSRDALVADDVLGRPLLQLRPVVLSVDAALREALALLHGRTDRIASAVNPWSLWTDLLVSGGVQQAMQDGATAMRMGTEVPDDTLVVLADSLALRLQLEMLCLDDDMPELGLLLEEVDARMLDSGAGEAMWLLDEELYHELTRSAPEHPLAWWWQRGQQEPAIEQEWPSLATALYTLHGSEVAQASSASAARPVQPVAFEGLRQTKPQGQAQRGRPLLQAATPAMAASTQGTAQAALQWQGQGWSAKLRLPAHATANTELDLMLLGLPADAREVVLWGLRRPLPVESGRAEVTWTMADLAAAQQEASDDDLLVLTAQTVLRGELRPSGEGS